MTIQIRGPELEALILERMRSGAFESVEDVLLQALKASPPVEATPARSGARTGADLVAAMQASPHREIDLEAARTSMPVRGVTF